MAPPLWAFVFQVAPEQAGTHLLTLVRTHTGLPTREARRAIETGGVMVGRRRIRECQRPIAGGVTIKVWIEEAGASSETAILEEGRILYRDRHLVAVDKPAGVPSQATLASAEGTVIALTQAALGGRPLHLVHRLDRETSGVMLLARTERAARALRAAFAARTIQKRYVALVRGVPEATEGVLDRPLARDRRRPGAWCVTRHGGRSAETAWTLERRLDAFGEGLAARLALSPRTGRTHQIRVHLAYLGHPILGDGRYGGPRHLTATDGRRLELPRVLLHAATLHLPHPITGRPLTLEAPIPADLRAIERALAERAPGR